MTETPSPQDPVDVLPDEEGEPISRDMLIEAYGLSSPPTDAWANHGDQGNTALHGGKWIIYDPEDNSWEIVHTEHVQDIFVDIDAFAYDDPGEQYIRSGSVNFNDIVTEDGKWTDEAEKYREDLNLSHRTPVGAVVDNDLTNFVVYFATYDNQHTGTAGQHIPDEMDLHEPGVVIREDYDSVLKYMGVTPADNSL